MYHFEYFWDKTNCMSIIERCPYYRGVFKERLDCINFANYKTQNVITCTDKSDTELVDYK